MENIVNVQNNTFFEELNKVHFVGVGGVSLSALCRMTQYLNIGVSGSNITSNEEVEKLINDGFDVTVGHCASNIPQDCDLVVYTGAIDLDNVEIVEAKRRKINIMERSEYLAKISQLYENVIAVAGSHGKTSTTAMISHIFKVAGFNPTMHLGGDSKQYGNLLLGDNKYFITEACEYRNSMSYLKPTTAVVTNIDNDHLDYYKTKTNLIKAFQKFANSATKHVIVGSERKFRKVERDNIIYSVGCNYRQDIYALDIRHKKNGYTFYVINKGKNLGKFKINLLGKHNIKNAVFAISVAMLYNIPLSKIKKGIRTYKGVKRRYEKVGKYNGVPIISDYAHHPTEIKNSILGLYNRYPNLLVVFQPHTYSRTKICLNEFSTAFINAKEIIIYKTYPARENYDKDGDEKALYKVVRNKKKVLTETYEDVVDNIDYFTNLYNVDAIVLMGAGDMPIDMVEILRNR